LIQEKVKMYRNRIKMTQKELAEKSNLSLGYIQMIESGTKKNPSISTILRIARALGVELSDLAPGNREATQEDIDKMFGPELNQNKVDRSNDLLEAAFTMSTYFFPGNEPKQQIEIPFSREDANGMIIDGFKKVLLSKRLQDIDFLKYKIRYYTRLLEELEKVSDSDPASE